MTFRHLEIFITVADLGSMTRASRQLYVSQPTVSQAIAELENHYGFPLFERFGRSLSITEEGKSILSYARHIQSLLGEMELSSKRQESSGLLRVGASMTIGTRLLPTMLQQLKEQVPQAGFQAFVRNTRDLESMLLKNQLDCCLLEGSIHYPELMGTPFLQDNLALVCGTSHPLYQIPVSDLPSLENQLFLVREPGSGTRELFESVMASAEINWEVGWECGDSSSLIHATERGFGIGVISGILVQDQLESGSLYRLPLPESTFRRTFRLVHHKNKYITPLMKRFFHQILETEKSRLRNEVLKKRNRLTPEELTHGAEELLEKVISLPEYQQAHRVMIYADFRKEAPTGLLMDQILQDGKRLVLPLTDKTFQIIPYELPEGPTEWRDHLIPSSFGVPEPDPDFWHLSDALTIDLVLVPGSVFDTSGGRIGYGKGCYDRFLPKLRPDVPKIALAYDFQVVSSVPTDNTDVPMDQILTITTHP